MLFRSSTETISEKTEVVLSHIRMGAINKKSEVLPSLSLINHLSMVEYVCYALNAVASPFANLAIYVTLTDGVV